MRSLRGITAILRQGSSQGKVYFVQDRPLVDPWTDPLSTLRFQRGSEGRVVIFRFEHLKFQNVLRRVSPFVVQALGCRKIHVVRGAHGQAKARTTNERPAADPVSQ